MVLLEAARTVFAFVISDILFSTLIFLCYNKHRTNIKGTDYMKKRVSQLLAVVLLFALTAGCGKQEDGDE